MNIIGYDRYEESLRCEVGNKAANISILHQKGYNVPRGFAITTSFLKNCVISPDNGKLIDSFGRLKPPIVVRSSAIGEDSRNRSFAGIFDSVLNIVSLDGYISAINGVCSSSEATVCKNYIAGEKPVMALLVQELVPAEHAGVVFTVNPVNGNSAEMIIEYFNGLGVSVVSGKVTPHHLVIDKNFKRIKTLIKSDRGIACFPNKSGGCQEVFLDGNKVTCVDEMMLAKIIETSIKLEMLFSCPQDIEWAVSKNKLFILQARPVTSLSGG